MKSKIYIAGKITSDPSYKIKFDAAAETYRKKGYLVLNPSWMPQGMQPSDYMRICFAMIDTADVVVFLPGFRLSVGAMLEYDYCNYTEKAIETLPDVRYAATLCGNTATMPMTMPMAMSDTLDPNEQIKKAIADSINKQLGVCSAIIPEGQLKE